MAVETYFLVAVNEDGSFTTYAELPEEPIEREKIANNYDVYQACKQIAEEFESQILVERITKAIASALVPPAPLTTADRIKDVLRERGINPESVEPVN